MAKERVVIIDYGSGNLRSAEKAFERVGAAHDIEIMVTTAPEHVSTADRIVLPGVGAFGDCAAGLRGIDGMYDALERQVIEKGRPFLGICVGAQLMATRGLERGVHKGFGWIDGDVVEIQPTDHSLKIPHMGWNTLAIRAAHPILCNVPNPTYAYFVHSFHMRPTHEHHVLATTDYGGAVTAMIGRDNLVGAQFHPEKSQAVGLKLLDNFLRWCP